MPKKETEEERRRKHNEEINQRRLEGDPLQHSPAHTWYPKRPKIKKDQKEIDRLYGDKDEQGK